MQSLGAVIDDRIRPEVWRDRLAYGIKYGAAAGAGFALFTWGGDAYALQQAHGLFPWLKLIVGLMLCGAVGAAAGWLAMRFDRTWLSIALWLLAALAFAWLVNGLPLQIAPRLTALLEPQLKGFMQEADPSMLSARLTLAYIWVAIFAVVTGILQLPLSDSGIYATSFLGRAAPMLVCIFVMGICGALVDSLTNEPLRSGVRSVNDTIQFALDHRGEDIDERDALRMHLAALRQVQEHVDRPRALVVADFDDLLGELVVMVRFGDVWATCASIYNQPSNCRMISP